MSDKGKVKTAEGASITADDFQVRHLKITGIQSTTQDRES